jgi:predicted amidophosphoribosyltransferase
MRDNKNRILGDRCAICPTCGFAQRYMEGHSEVREPACPDCGSDLLVGCSACGETIASVMQVNCRACGEPLRAPELFGGPIRRKPEPSRDFSN